MLTNVFCCQRMHSFYFKTFKPIGDTGLLYLYSQGKYLVCPACLETLTLHGDIITLTEE